MLRQHVEPACPRDGRVLSSFCRRFHRGLALHNLEPVCRDHQRLARLIEPMVRPANTLRQTARPLGRTDIDDKIDITPIDAEIERRCAHDST